MSKIQELLNDKNDQIDYKKIIQDHPWLLGKNESCVLSPDSDGLLSGLFMSHFLNWKIRGFYDGKVMLLEKRFRAEECVFLDIEIFRKEIRSIGHHMLEYNKNQRPDNWENFQNCVQPNILRNYDACREFRLKYPLATIHLLIGIVSSKIKINIPVSAICPLLFTDGTFNVLYKYPENVLNWLNYLRANEEKNPLKKIFENEKYSVFSLMLAMDSFFRKRDEISVPRERGDRLKISNTYGTSCNISKKRSFFEIERDAQKRILSFITILSDLTGWEYKKNNWNWTNFDLFEFTKRDFKKDKLSVNSANFKNFLLKNPLSWAITSGQNAEYTTEDPDKLP